VAFLMSSAKFCDANPDGMLLAFGWMQPAVCGRRFLVAEAGLLLT